MTKLGRIGIHVQLIARAWDSECLYYTLRGDQTYLPGWISTVATAVQAIEASKLD